MSEPGTAVEATATRRFRVIWLAPVLLLIGLLAWVFASPIGAAPDDDFHLTSTWCDSAINADMCQPGDSAKTRTVPEAIAHGACFAAHPNRSAACQQDPMDPTATTLTDRGNFNGGYPPVYYAVMSIFTSHDIVVSALVMRVVNVLLFVGGITALYLLLPFPRRGALIWGWAVTTIPLGVFLLASNNPSAWATMGVGFAWIALLGYFETSGRRRIALGAIFAASILMAAGARGDAALYSVIAIGAVGVLTFRRRRIYALESILPLVMVVVAIAFFLTSRQVTSGIEGFGSGNIADNGAVADGNGVGQLSGFGLLAYNLLNIQGLWAGVLGNWGLGWLDTAMPAVVTFGCVAAFAAVGFVGLSRVTWRKLVVVIGLVVVLWVLPVYVLVQGGDQIGSSVQPRYLLPLIVLLGGILLVTAGGQRIRFTRVQSVVVVTTLSLANFIALHLNIRRYVTGVDGQNWNLDANREWWWHMPITPMMVWLVGSVAFAAALVIVVRQLRIDDRAELAARESAPSIAA